MNAWDRRAGAEDLAPPPVSAPHLSGKNNGSFRATIRGRQAVRFAGSGGFYDAELLKGGLGGLIGFGLQQLGRPTGLVAQVRRGRFKVYVPAWTRYDPRAGTKPREDGQFQNLRGPCRIPIIEGRELAVFRFNKKIPRGLKMAMKDIFTGPEYTLRGETLLEGDENGTGQEDRGEGEPFAPDLPQSEPGEDSGRGEPAVNA